MVAGVAQADVTVFAASSLRGALDDVNALSPVEVRVSYAGSAALARQIDQRAPADVFLSANLAWADWLETRLTDPVQTYQILGNKLVLIAAEGAQSFAETDLSDVLSENRLAMGHTRSVPAGIYGREALTSLGLWDEVSSNILETDNVRSALRFVALGEVPYAITYTTDALADPSVTPVFEFPQASHAPIRYALMQLSDHPDAEEYRAFLQSDPAQKVFQAHGFESISDE